MSTIKIFNGTAITPSGNKENATILVKDGIIESISEGHQDVTGATEIDAKGKFIAPGLVDNQVNGFAGVSFSLGWSELTEEGIEMATRELWKYGVTTYLPTLTTNSQQVMVKNLKILAKSITNKELYGSIPGFHLEGPYITPKDGYRGAHPKEYVRLPDWQEFEELYEASGQRILQITLAPEMEGALDFISKCKRQGIIVALGHHDASAEIVTAAIDRGATIATHLGNRAANTINRHRNPFWSQLADDRLHISIICDNFHLLPEEIQVFFKVKGVDRIIITSDVTSFATLKPGLYKTESEEIIELTEEGLLHFPAQNCLYGSASPITKGVGHSMKVTGCSISDAIQMASTNPARSLGLNHIGELAKGKRADLILFTLENDRIEIQKTILAGEIMYSRI